MQKNIYEGDVIVVHPGSEPITVVFPGEVKPIAVNLTPGEMENKFLTGVVHPADVPDLKPVGDGENEIIDLVAAFHEVFLHPILPTPQIPSTNRAQLRVNIMQEELDEFIAALAKGDLVGIADALCDLQYVLTGTVLEFGMGSAFMGMFREVHGSNMTKACRTETEAVETVRSYVDKGVPAYILENTPEDGSPKYWLVYRMPDNKTLKSINYKPVNLERFLTPASELRGTVVPEMKRSLGTIIYSGGDGKNPMPFPGGKGLDPVYAQQEADRPAKASDLSPFEIDRLMLLGERFDRLVDELTQYQSDTARRISRIEDRLTNDERAMNQIYAILDKLIEQVDNLGDLNIVNASLTIKPSAPELAEGKKPKRIAK